MAFCLNIVELSEAKFSQPISPDLCFYNRIQFPYLLQSKQKRTCFYFSNCTILRRRNCGNVHLSSFISLIVLILSKHISYSHKIHSNCSQSCLCSYVGRSYVKASGRPADILERLNEMAGFPPNEEIQLYEVSWFCNW